MVASAWGDGTPNEAYEIPPNAIIIEQAASYLITDADAGHVIDYIGTGGHVFTLPATVDVGNGFVIWLRNKGTGSLVVDPQGADTADVAGLGVAQMVQLIVKGTVFTRLASAALDGIASAIGYTPSGALGATNVQAAIDELEAEKLAIAGGTMTGKLVLAAGADIASAATLDLTAATGNFIRVTGTVAISAVTMTAGQQCRIVADAALPLVYHATNNKINTGGLDVVLAAGDMVQYTRDLAGTIHGEVIKTSGNSVGAKVNFLSNQFFPTF